MPPSYRKPRDLPAELAVFPLDGALLLPRTVLPLNIFEPRYLNMIDDALAGDRLIGMIQTRDFDPGDGPAAPALQSVGCAGRLTVFNETPDGRYLVSLSGVARFHVLEELDVATPYRKVRADFGPFARDFAPEPDAEAGTDRAEIIEALRAFLAAQDLAADWSSMREAPLESLVNSLSMACPFEPAERQALLEAPTLADRSEVLLTLLKLRSAGPAGGAA